MKRVGKQQAGERSTYVTLLVPFHCWDIPRFLLHNCNIIIDFVYFRTAKSKPDAFRFPTSLVRSIFEHFSALKVSKEAIQAVQAG